MDFVHRRRSFSSLGLALTSVALAVLSGCVQAEPVDEDDGGDVGAAREEIIGGSPADIFSRQRSVFMMPSGCTGIIIGRRHVLSASHCKPTPGDSVVFYTSTDPATPPPPDFSTEHLVLDVSFPSGVDPFTKDYTDTAGRFADIAVLHLAMDIPATSAVADLAWTYPGASVWGTKVGASRVSALIDDSGLLRMIPDQTDTASDGGGSFLTKHDQTAGGDSGGPFYVGSRVAGVLYGIIDYGAWQQAKYTSVPVQLPSILNQMDYTFSGTILATGYIITGDDLTSLTGRPQDVCAYACEHTAQCVAFNHYPNLGGIQNYCQLKKTLTGFTTFANATPGIK